MAEGAQARSDRRPAANRFVDLTQVERRLGAVSQKVADIRGDPRGRLIGPWPRVESRSKDLDAEAEVPQTAPDTRVAIRVGGNGEVRAILGNQPLEPLDQLAEFGFAGFL